MFYKKTSWKLDNRPVRDRKGGQVKEMQLSCPDFHLHVKNVSRGAQKDISIWGK